MVGTPREVRGPGGRVRSARRMFASTVLSFEALVVVFAALVAYGLRLAEPVGIALVAGVFVLGAVVATRLLGRRPGYLLGWALQGWLLLGGLLIPALLVVGAIFVVLWIVGLRLGGRIDSERAEREAASSAG